MLRASRCTSSAAARPRSSISDLTKKIRHILKGSYEKSLHSSSARETRRCRDADASRSALPVGSHQHGLSIVAGNDFQFHNSKGNHHEKVLCSSAACEAWQCRNPDANRHALRPVRSMHHGAVNFFYNSSSARANPHKITLGHFFVLPRTPNPHNLRILTQKILHFCQRKPVNFQIESYTAFRLALGMFG